MGLRGSRWPPSRKRSERGAKSNTIIRSGGLNEDIINDAGGHDFSVGFGIERHAAGEAEILAVRFLQCHAHHIQHRGFAHILDRIGDVFVKIGDVAFRFTW